MVWLLDGVDVDASGKCCSGVGGIPTIQWSVAQWNLLMGAWLRGA